MIARIAFVHTVGFLADEFRKLMRSELPDIDSFHILNESLLKDLLRGVPPAAVYRRATEQVLLADAIRAVDVKAGDGACAEREMRRLGARPIRYEDLAP